MTSTKFLLQCQPQSSGLHYGKKGVDNGYFHITLTAGTFDKRCSSSLLHNALFCAEAITSCGSCLIAVVASLKLKQKKILNTLEYLVKMDCR